MLRFLVLLFLFNPSLLKAEEETKHGIKLGVKTLQLNQVVTGPLMQTLYLQASGQSGNVHIYLDSPGGDFNAAKWFVAKFEHLRAKGKQIHCYAGNLVASAAFYIYLHCDARYALPTSKLFPHKIHILYREPVLPQELIVTGMDTLQEQLNWDKKAAEITGMNPDDYLAFRDSDDSLWTIKQVLEKSHKKWFQLLDFYLLRVGT